jgi:hypothetical protein
VSNQNEIRDFLTSRRAKVAPEDAGLPAYGRTRRVPGLRREEVALLAGISVEYYTRIERGNVGGASESVLDAMAPALQLDEAERSHLFDLVGAAQARAPRRKRPQERVRPTVQQVLDSMTTVPALVGNGRADILSANRLAYALFSEVFADPARPANNARFVFLNSKASEFLVDWGRAADDVVASLRAEAGRDPYDRRLTDLIGELSTRSEDFRVRWAAHNVRFHRTGTKRLHHSFVGELTLNYEAFDLPADEGQRMVVYTVEPGSLSAEALDILASWEGRGHVTGQHR